MIPIKTEGYWYNYEGRYLVSMTEIYSTLIYYAGRFCESYSSDILYEIEAIRRLFIDREEDSVTDFCIGIRAMGVDDIAYTCAHLDDSKVNLNDYYRAMFILSIHRKGDKVSIELKRVNAYEMKEYLNEHPKTENE